MKPNTAEKNQKQNNIPKLDTYSVKLEESTVWENGEGGKSKTMARTRERNTTRIINKGFTDKTTI